MALRSSAPSAGCHRRSLMLLSVVTPSGKASWTVLKRTTTSGLVSMARSRRKGSIAHCQKCNLFSFSLLTEVAFLLIILRSNSGRTGGISSLQGTDKICRKLLQTVCHLKIQVRPTAVCVCVNLQHCASMPVSDIQVQLWKCSRHLLCLSTLAPGEEVLKLLHSCSPFNLEELKKQESQLPPEDSEWAD